MSRINKILFFHLLLLVSPKLILAQDHIVHGVVHAFDSIPLIGAEIFVKSTQQKVITNSSGVFTVPCNSKDKLIISARGFTSRKVKITEQIKLIAVNLKLKHIDEVSSEEIRQYAIGYGFVSERDRTTSTSRLTKNEASYSRYSTVFDMIEGQFPGVEVRNEEIIIRGTNSLNLSSAALIVLDGVIVESDVIRNLRPREVKNIDVIKDGSAAIYGSRGANGVVLIETVKGGDEVK